MRARKFAFKIINLLVTLWCHRFDQKTNKIFLRISALASKKRSDQKNKGTLYNYLIRDYLTLLYNKVF